MIRLTNFNIIWYILLLQPVLESVVSNYSGVKKKQTINNVVNSQYHFHYVYFLVTMFL